MPRRGQRLAGWIVVVLSILGLLTTWALATARYGGPDEPGHVLRSASVARGQLLGEPVPGLVAGFREVTVPAALATGDPRCFRHDRRQPATCAVADPGASGTRVVATSVGSYPPWYDALVGLPVRVLGDASQVIWYRLVAAAWCAIALALCLGRAQRIDVTVVMVAVSPAMWFLFGVVNPNSLEIALVLLAWVGVERFRTSHATTVAEMWWIGGPLGIAIAIRPVAAVAAATVGVTMTILGRGRGILRRRHWLAFVAAPGAAVVASIAWGVWSATSVSDARQASPGSVLGRIGEALSGTGDTLRELAGSMGWLEFSAPWPAQALWWSAVGFGGVAAWRSVGHLRVAWSLIAISVLAVPIVFESVLAGRIGFIWQGRYSISTALGLIVVGSAEWRAWLTVRRRRRVVICALVLAEILTFWSTLRRYTVGTRGSLLLRDIAWHPPMSPFVLFLANAILVSWVIISCNALHGSDPRGSWHTCCPLVRVTVTPGVVSFSD